VTNGDPLQGDELVIRRFNPEGDLHCTHDDAGHPSGLKSNALYFKTSAIGFACSIYRDSVLEPLSLTLADLIEKERPTYRLASIRVDTALGVSYLHGPNPLSFIEDEFPDGNPPPHARDEAHAAILRPEKVVGLDRFLRDIAARFEILPVTA